MGKLRLRRRGRHCGGGVGMGRHMVVYFCVPGSLHQSAELLQQPAAQPGPPFVSPADTPALRRDAAGGNCRWLLEAGEVGLGPVGLGEYVQMVRGGCEGYRRLGTRKPRLERL